MGEKFIHNFGGKSQKKKKRERQLGISALDGMAIKSILRKSTWEDVKWIDLAQERNKWSALVNKVMNPRVPCNSTCLTG